VRPFDWPPMNIELNATPEQLWEVRTNIDENWYSEPTELTKDDFIESGIIFQREFFATVKRCGLNIGHIIFAHKTWFECGCGVGRYTYCLSQLFEHVLAADISPSHLYRARENLERFDRDNVYFGHFGSFDAFEVLPQFDAFISLAVLRYYPHY
jgi:SAM-dependent methyltransferase